MTTLIGNTFGALVARHEDHTAALRRELGTMYAEALVDLAGPTAHALTVNYNRLPSHSRPDPVRDPRLCVIDAFGESVLRLLDGWIPPLTAPRLRDYWGEFDLTRRVSHERVLDHLRRMGALFPVIRIGDDRHECLPLSDAAVEQVGGERVPAKGSANAFATDPSDAQYEILRTAHNDLARLIADTITELIPDAAYMTVGIWGDHMYNYEDTYPMYVLDARGTVLHELFNDLDVSRLSARTRAGWGRHLPDFPTFRMAITSFARRGALFDELPDDIRELDHITENERYCVVLRSGVRVGLPDPDEIEHRLSYESPIRPYRPSPA
ncbi:hypothetical protein ACFZBU_42160 [Embleya sp. NPDC008237]|uniref:hypothetical protein n=1 Tax=Embleya sp. NPDC008237 TaxID=3363978 RepID=UPI0036E144D2